MLHAKERMCTIDSGVSLNLVALSSWKKQRKATSSIIQQNLECKYCQRFVVSDTQVQDNIVEVGTFRWVHLVEDSPSMLSLEEDNTVNLVLPVRGRLAECSIKSAVLMANGYRTLRFTVSDSQGQLLANNRRGGRHVDICHRRTSKQK